MAHTSATWLVNARPANVRRTTRGACRVGKDVGNWPSSANPFLDNFWFANNPGTIYTQGAQAAVKFLEFLHRPWKLNSNGGFLRYNGSNDSLRPSGLVNRIPAHNRADNLKVLDFLFVHREEIVRHDNEVR